MNTTSLHLTNEEQAALDLLLARDRELSPLLEAYTADFQSWLNALASCLDLDMMTMLTTLTIRDGKLVAADPAGVGEALADEMTRALASSILTLFPQ